MAKIKKDIVIKDISNSLALDKRYKTMLSNISKSLPEVKKLSSNFYKSHSQFMGVMLDVTAITPVRSIKHTLAEIYAVKQALEQGQINLAENNILIRKREEHIIKKNLTGLDREHMELKILKLRVANEGTKEGMQGAIRKMSFFITQYKSILKSIGKKSITEKEYEEEEIKYHIMTCMKQALISARSRNGIIDHGNLIYLFDMGINSGVAQKEVFDILKKENEMLENNETPTHGMELDWLEHCANLFKNDCENFANRRGFKLRDDKSLLDFKK